MLETDSTDDRVSAAHSFIGDFGARRSRLRKSCASRAHLRNGFGWASSHIRAGIHAASFPLDGEVDGATITETPESLDGDQKKIFGGKTEAFKGRRFRARFVGPIREQTTLVWEARLRMERKIDRQTL